MAANQLPIKQERFVETYSTCTNLAEALATAGYAPHHTAGSKLLKKPHIQAAIERREKRLPILWLFISGAIVRFVSLAKS